MSCSGDNKPANSDLKATLTHSLPSHIEINSFSIKASQNFGNKVEPIYASRFQASVVSLVDLYKIDKKDKKVIFVRLATEKGKEIEIFGKIKSRLYQGGWKHDIDIDGTPIRHLGVLLNQISAEHVIVRGSNEEKKHLAEIKRREAELRRNISNAKKIFVGTWRDENSLVTFKADGTYVVKFNNGNENYGKWNVVDDYISLKAEMLKYKDGKTKSLNVTYKSQIIYIDKNRYTMKDSDSTKWHGKRIK